jgi:DNA-binding MarR family transcriptional regulator
MTVKQLVAFLMVSRQNLAAVLDRLEAAGLVERTRIEGDGRLRHVALTAQGEATWTAMQANICTYYADALETFTTEEAVTLFRLLDRLRDSLACVDTTP